MRHWSKWLGWPMALIILAAGCSSQSGVNISQRKIKATVTVGMVADTVRHVGGDRVEVTSGLSEGDTIVVRGQGSLYDGAQVEVVKGEQLSN